MRVVPRRVPLVTTLFGRSTQRGTTQYSSIFVAFDYRCCEFSGKGHRTCASRSARLAAAILKHILRVMWVIKDHLTLRGHITADHAGNRRSAVWISAVSDYRHIRGLPGVSPSPHSHACPDSCALRAVHQAGSCRLRARCGVGDGRTCRGLSRSRPLHRPPTADPAASMNAVLFGAPMRIAVSRSVASPG
jgi:hypothetical protein